MISTREKCTIPIRLLLAIIPWVWSLGCTTLAKVEHSIEPGQYYVLDGPTQTTRFEFLPHDAGRVRVIKTIEHKDPEADGSNISREGRPRDTVEVFYIANRETGVIEFSPDLERDLGETIRAFLPRLPEPGQQIDLGTVGDAIISGNAPFSCVGTSSFEFRGRHIPVVILTAKLGGHQDTLHYSVKTGIIVYARFVSGMEEFEFRLIDTNIPL